MLKLPYHCYHCEQLSKIGLLSYKSIHILSCSFLGWLGSGFFFTIQMGDAQSLIDFEMQLASSRSLISSSVNDLYLRGIVYGLDATGKPVVGRYISIKLVLPKSADDLETIHSYWLLIMWFSLSLADYGTSASCSIMVGLPLSLAWIWKLECSGKAGSHLWILGGIVHCLIFAILDLLPRYFLNGVHIIYLTNWE